MKWLTVLADKNVQCRLVSSESTTTDTLKGVSAVVGFTGDTNGGQQTEGRIE